MIAIRRATLLLALLGSVPAPAALAPTGPGAAGDELGGTYRLQGSARVALGTVLGRELEVHADAVLGRGATPGEVLVRVDAEGYGCDLVARVDPAGALAFAPGQPCTVRISSPDARGRLQARLRSGRGRVGSGRLSLDLSGDVDGTLQRRTGGVRVLGQQLPDAWTPELPVHGAVEASAAGTIDHSRAAQR